MGDGPPGDPGESAKVSAGKEFRSGRDSAIALPRSTVDDPAVDPPFKSRTATFHVRVSPLSLTHPTTDDR